jgi:tRNA(Ile)-lysidine synthase
VGLLRVLHHLAPELGLRLSVAHLDHGVRGEEARADAAFVEELAGGLGLPFDLGHWRPEQTGRFEARARQARYRWLREIAVSRSAKAVAVGHTRDDQAETILHRIVRGTGPRGLAGIPWRRALSQEPPVTLVRPLLSVSRQAIRESLEALGQGFREDSSNADLSRTRARIRLDLLPRLAADYNPRVAEAIARLGVLVSTSERLMDRWLVELEHDVMRFWCPERIEFHRDRLIALPRVLRAEVLRRAWRKAGWPEAGMTAKRWCRLVRLARSPRISRFHIGAGVELTTAGPKGQPSDVLILDRVLAAKGVTGAAVELQEVPLDVPGAVSWGGGRIAAFLEPDDTHDEHLDLDRIILPLRIRAPGAGDRFAPLGLEGRSMSLNDFFRGRKVGREARGRTPLVCDAIGIIWVAGHRIADRVKVTGQTARRLGLQWTLEDTRPGCV